VTELNRRAARYSSWFNSFRQIHPFQKVSKSRVAAEIVVNDVSFYSGDNPPLAATFARVQRELRDKVRDVHFISISVDPLTDTPETIESVGR
jgi:hypothetical protein